MYSDIKVRGLFAIIIINIGMFNTTATSLLCDMLCLYVGMETREYCFKRANSEDMFTSREESLKEKSWNADNIRCRCDVVCDSSIWAPSRRSVLPHRLRCHNKITGGLLDSSSPQGFC